MLDLSVLLQGLADGSELGLGNIDLALASVAIDDHISARTVFFAPMTRAVFTGTGAKAFDIGAVHHEFELGEFAEQSPASFREFP